MTSLSSLILLVLVVALGYFLFTRASGLVRFFVGLAVFCVAVAFLVPFRRQVQLVFPPPLERIVVAIENVALYGVNLLVGFLRYLGGLFGIS